MLSYIVDRKALRLCLSLRVNDGFKKGPIISASPFGKYEKNIFESYLLWRFSLPAARNAFVTREIPEFFQGYF